MQKIKKSLTRLLKFFFQPNKNDKMKLAITAIFIIGIIGGGFIFPATWNKIPKIPRMPEKPFSLGLDLQGGTHLLYKIEFKEDAANRQDTANGIRDVIERRINLFGVKEPLVQIDQTGNEYRLIVELAGVTNIEEAVTIIGETPSLDFRRERVEKDGPIEISEENVNEQGEASLPLDQAFVKTGLNGSHLKTATLEFDSTTNQPLVSLEFNQEGAEMFARLTKENINKRIGIFLDEQLLSAPTVQTEILQGKAQITGQFTIEEAKQLARRLQAGALPVPISLLSQDIIGPSLGRASLQASLKAALWAFVLIAIFMVLFYRLPGFLAVIALLFYAILILSIFKLIPITLTLAGIAGLILSVGMAVDANILIFERFKEERRTGRSIATAIDEGSSRAWQAIRDSNVSTLITTGILFMMGTGFVKGFALTLFIGIAVSMFTAMVITKLLMKILASEKTTWLWPK